MTKFLENLHSTLANGDVDLVKNVFLFVNNIDEFFNQIQEEQILRTYRTILLVNQKNEETPQRILEVDEVIQLIKNIESPKLGIALDVLALTLIILKKDDSSLKLTITENLTNDHRNLCIVNTLMQYFVWKNCSAAEEESHAFHQSILEFVQNLIAETDCDQIYLASMDIVKLLLSEKLISMSNIHFQRTRKERYFQILCDLIEFIVPNDEEKEHFVIFLEREELMATLFSELQTVNDNLYDKRLFFLVEQVVTYVSNFSIEFTTDLIDFKPISRTSFKVSWDAFFAIAESLKENQRHLILPAFSMINKLNFLDSRWKKTVLERGFQNENAGVQFWCAEFVLKNPDLWPFFDGKSHFADVINNNCFFEDCDVSNIPKFLEKHWLPLEKLQKPVPMYHIFTEFLKAMKTNRNINKSMKLLRTKGMVMVAKSCTNTKIRSAIFNELWRFICKEKLYTHIDEIRNLDQFSTVEGMEIEVNGDIVKKIYESNLPIHLKTQFHCSKEDVDGLPVDSHAEIHLLNTKVESIREAIVTKFTRDLENNQIPSLNFEVLKLFFNKRLLNTPQPDDLDQHILINCVNGLVSTSVDTLFSISSNISVKNAALEVIEASRMWSVLNTTVQSKCLQALNIKKIIKNTTNESLKAASKQEVSKFNEGLCKLRLHLISSSKNDFYKENFEAPLSTLLEESINFVNCGGVNSLISELNLLRILFQQLINSGQPVDFQLIQQNLGLLYTETMSYKGTLKFSAVLDSFIRTIIWSEKINFEWFNNITLPYYEKFLKQAPTTRGLANNLFDDLTHGLTHLLRQKEFSLIRTVTEMPSFLNLFIKGLTFGEIKSRDKRIESQLVSKLSEMDRVDRDALVRLKCNTFIMTHQNEEIYNEFFEKLKMSLINKFLELSKANSRYFGDSKTHREKLRITQSLCFLFLRNSCEIAKVGQILFNENNQLNVTYLLELMVAYFAPEELFEHYIERDFVEKLKPSALQSLFVVIFYRCQQNPTLMEKYLDIVIPFTMGQHFATRLYAQITVLKLSNSQNPLKNAIESCFKMQPDKNLARCVNDFRYLFPNYAKDDVISLANVLHHIPRITKMSEEEIISSLSGSLDDIQVMPETPTSRAIESQTSSEAENVQRKIMPPDSSLFESLPTFIRQKKTKKSELIVVASLLQKLPNLGGLARTCEIFNVNTYVISSFRHMQQPDFENLSVAAEKWLNVAQIQTWELPEYLKSLKASGYCLVGAEQTKKSQKLQEYKFPSKTVLLLGEEKQGIPANLISLLDVAVEVPQFGVCRSLNVHVCASLCIWEYARQNQC